MLIIIHNEETFLQPQSESDAEQPDLYEDAEGIELHQPAPAPAWAPAPVATTPRTARQKDPRRLEKIVLCEFAVIRVKIIYKHATLS